MRRPWRRSRWYWDDHEVLRGALIGAAIGALLVLLSSRYPVYGFLLPTLIAEVLHIRLWEGDMPRSVPLLFLGSAVSWTLLGAGVGTLVGFFRKAARYRRRRRSRRIRRGPPRCAKCGYNLTGNVSGVCPECGTPIARHHV